jgi:DNA ligase (NAD+)
MKLIADVSDIYYLSKPELLRVEHFADKAASNLLASIEGSKERPFSRLIAALGIRHVGARVSEVLADSFRSMGRLRAATAEQLVDIPEIGPKIAESIVDFFAEERNRRVIERLVDAGVVMEERETGESSKSLEGLTFVVTGSIAGFTREQMESLIKQRGGRPSGSVGAKTDYVIAGEKPGSKLEKARRLGVKVIAPGKFMKMIGEA